MNALEVKNLKKRFGNNEVLKGVGFNLEEGRVLSIIGPSGGGKTTLLRCITQLEVPNEGKISVGGEIIFDADDKSKLSAKEKRRRQLKMGLVFQQYHLFPQYDVLDNVTLAGKLLAKEREDYKKNKKDIIESINMKGIELLKNVGLQDKLNNYPCELSGGQQQRVAIARALALSPEVLFFDEPTSALDPELTIEVLAVMRELAAEKMTMVVVTHEMSFARDISDYVVFMDGGVPAVYGSSSEVFGGSSNERLNSFLGSFNKK